MRVIMYYVSNFQLRSPQLSCYKSHKSIPLRIWFIVVLLLQKVDGKI